MFETKSFKIFRQFTLSQYRLYSPQLKLDLVTLLTIALQVSERRNIKIGNLDVDYSLVLSLRSRIIFRH